MIVCNNSGVEQCQPRGIFRAAHQPGNQLNRFLQIVDVFAQPEMFDLRRANSSKSLAFGFGIHYCLGAALGKLEARLALEALTSRFPNLRLVEGQELSFHPNISFRGPQSLWVRATQRP